MVITGQNHIGDRKSSLGPGTFRAVNPALNEEMEPPFHAAIWEEVDQAMRVCDAAWAEFRRRSAAERANFLRAIALEIEQLGEQLIARAADETGLPPARLTGERGRTIAQLRMFADLLQDGSWVDARIDHGDANRQPAPKPDVRRMLTPIGPVAVFGASNFPLAFSVAGGDTASALAAGCSVVVKAHPSHPGTSELVIGTILGAARKTGMPDGVVSLLQGIDPEVSLALVRHPLTRAVGFTGSLRAGRALFDAAAARSSPIPVYAEMGSINPVFLLPGALRTRGGPIAQGLMNSVMLGVGQFCTKPGVVICLDDDATADFVGQMRKLVSRAPAGTMLNRALAGAFAEGRRGWAGAAGVHIAAEAPAAPGVATHGLPALFTTDGEHFLSDPTLRQELFGPATLIVTVQSAAELERVADNLDGQLTATIHAAPGELAEHPGLTEILQRKAGRLIMNGYPTGVEVCPAMHHGGPYPASTDCRSTSVGTAAIERFVRPVCYQDFPSELLPPELQDGNPLGIWRLIDGRLQR